MRQPWRRSALIGAGLILALGGPVMAENKLAFVVGINAYPNLDADAQLQRAVTDAESVGDALQGLGFTVTRVTDKGTLDRVADAFDQFTHSIQSGDTVLFYYAGHGISLSDGNYLIPADIPSLGPDDERSARRHSLSEREIKQDLHASGAKVAVVVLDMCRNNPFPARGTRSIGGTRGLARFDTAEGVFSLYSAREGQAALDRLSDTDPDPNSVFTRVFLKELKKPGESLLDLGEDVRDEVAALARSTGREQVPAISNDLEGARQVYFLPPNNHQTNGPMAQGTALASAAQGRQATSDSSAKEYSIGQFPVTETSSYSPTVIQAEAVAREAVERNLSTILTTAQKEKDFKKFMFPDLLAAFDKNARDFDADPYTGSQEPNLFHPIKILSSQTTTNTVDVRVDYAIEGASEHTYIVYKMGKRGKFWQIRDIVYGTDGKNMRAIVGLKN